MAPRATKAMVTEDVSMVKVEASTDADYPARSRLYRDGRVAPRHGLALRHGLAVRHGVALRHGLALSGSV